jgi:hypothetical protein
MPLSPSHDWTFLKTGILVCALSLLTVAQQAQQPRSPRLPAPPPMRAVTPEERIQLNAQRDPKARLRTSMEFAESRLTRTEQFTADRKFDQASEELGGFLGVLDNTRAFLGSMDHDKGSTRDLYKRLEIILRAQIPRLAVMRRSTPAQYAGNLKDAEEYLREARSEALDSFYGHSVLREGAGEKKPESPKDPEGGKHP